jgi:hypothetical protein
MWLAKCVKRSRLLPPHGRTDCDKSSNLGHGCYRGSIKLILKRQFQYFGPFPTEYEEIASPMTVAAIVWLMNEI